MAKIKFAGLGGLNEKGKNMYFLEVDSEIFIIDAGYSIPDNNNLGVEFIIPNIEYLIQNKDKIKGIFISHGHDDNFGALLYIQKEFVNVPIYTSIETKSIINTTFERWSKTIPNNIHDIKSNIIQKIGSITVEAIDVTHSVPGTYGFIFRTKDGNIVYLTDYIFKKSKTIKGMDPKVFAKISQENNLMLLSDSSSLGEVSHNSNISIEHYIKNILNNKIKNGRILFSAYDQDIETIASILKLAKDLNKKVIIYGLTGQTHIKNMMKLNAVDSFKISDYKDLGKKEIFNDLWVIFTGSADKLFEKVLKTSSDEDDNLVLSKQDLWVNLAPPFPGNEKIATISFNQLAKKVDDILLITNKEIRQMNPLKSDLELMLSFIEPKFLIAIKGYYKEMIIAKKIMEDMGYDKNNAILPENGEMHLFENGTYKGVERRLKEIGNVVVENSSSSTIAEEIIEERHLLSKEGVCIIGIMWSTSKKELISEIDIQMRGVMFLKKHENIVTLVKEKTMEIVNSSKDNFNQNNINRMINKELTKILRRYINKTPLILPHIILVD